jgi:organic radical activating enzyme
VIENYTFCRLIIAKKIFTSEHVVSSRWKLLTNITSLGLHLTDSCNAKCPHCAFNCSPNIKGCMELEKAKSYASEAKALGTEIVCITGGEPMLYPRLVKEIVSECNRLSIPETWLFTNGFWAKNSSRTRTITEDLKKRGLTKVFLSVDDFHQRYVPIEFIKNATEASLKADLEVCIDARFIGQPDEDNRYNTATRSLLEFLGSLLSSIEITRGQPLFVGRAAESLSKHVRKKPTSEILDEKCPGAWPGGLLKSPLGVDVDEFGFVTICPGLSIGNAYATSLRDTLEKYDYQNLPVISALSNNGMEGLMDLASINGFVPENVYVNGCHFCYEARKFLRGLFPNSFVFLAK